MCFRNLCPLQTAVLTQKLAADPRLCLTPAHQQSSMERVYEKEQTEQLCALSHCTSSWQSGVANFPTWISYTHHVLKQSPGVIFQTNLFSNKYSFTLSVSITSHVNEFHNGIMHHVENKKQNVPPLLSLFLTSCFHQIPLVYSFHEE